MSEDEQEENTENPEKNDPPDTTQPLNRIHNPAYIFSCMIKHSNLPDDKLLLTYLKQAKDNQLKKELFVLFCSQQLLSQALPDLKFELLTVAEIRQLISMMHLYFGFDTLSNLVFLIIYAPNSNAFFWVRDYLSHGKLLIDPFQMQHLIS